MVGFNFPVNIQSMLTAAARLSSIPLVLQDTGVSVVQGLDVYTKYYTQTLT